MSKNNHATNYSKNLNKTYTSETKLYIDDTTQQKNYTIDESAKNELKISSDMELITSKEEKKYSIYKFMRILCIIGFAIFTILFFNEIIIQPYRIKKSVDLTRTLYYRPSNELTTTTSPTLAPTNIVVSTTPIPEVVTVESGLNPNKDELGRLLTFKNLLSENDDVKGWITIKDTNIDYVVMQSEVNDPNYYLHKDINKKYSKAGTLYLDIMSSVDNNTQNYVIHGHNMVSTHEKMFHYLLEYKDISYYKEHPIISFDTIYNTGLWKIFAVIKTTPEVNEDYFFEYRKSNFTDSSDFLNFVYQIHIRSLLVIDTVNINENDQLLTLSTCSYEVNNNYRTVIFARKVRNGENSSVDIDSVYINENPLYADDYYYRYGGEAPKLAATFEEALVNNEINWYTPSVNNLEKIIFQDRTVK